MNIQQYVEAHGSLGATAWVIFFPLGAILMRVVPGRTAVYAHAAVQLFALMMFASNFGLGVYITKKLYFSLKDYHPTIGIVLFAFVCTQPISGVVHHMMYRKKGSRSILTYIHIWLGRLLITLGMIQGGLGLLFAVGQSTRAEHIAYGVVAGVVWLTYIGIVVATMFKGKGRGVEKR